VSQKGTKYLSGSRISSLAAIHTVFRKKSGPTRAGYLSGIRLGRP